MDTVLDAVAILILLAGGIGALRAFAKGDKTNALTTGLVALLVSSILSPTSRGAWGVIINAVISGAGKIFEKLSGTL